MKTRAFARSSLAILAVILGGCMVGPDYHRPPLNVPARYKELPGWTAATPADSGPKGDWWVDFHDPMLDRLEPMVSVSNETVRASYANYQQALAEIRVARSGLFPTIGISGATTRQRGASGNFGNSGTGGTNIGSAPGALVTNAGSLEGNISWAPDLWGKVRRTVEEATATAQASAATYANATLSARVALATAVIELRISDANIDLLQKTVDADRENLRVVEDQGSAGTTPPSDVIIARTQWENAQANLINLGVARAQFAHAIGVLVGENPEDLDIPHSTSIPNVPSIPVGVPSTLLERRPDIATAERTMAAQNAAIGVAVAAYYPDLTLSAVVGFTQSPLAGLFHIANYVWALGANASETLFDAGARSAEVDAAKAAYDAAAATYRGTVLSAFQNVENDLSGLRILAEQATVLDAAVRDATHGAEIALNEYQAGTVDYTTVSTALATQLADEQSVLNVQAQRLVDAASLVGDLGGGWTP